jgi:hypothetical protein
MTGRRNILAILQCLSFKLLFDFWSNKTLILSFNPVTLVGLILKTDDKTFFQIPCVFYSKIWSAVNTTTLV